MERSELTQKAGGGGTATGVRGRELQRRKTEDQKPLKKKGTKGGGGRDEFQRGKERHRFQSVCVQKGEEFKEKILKQTEDRVNCSGKKAQATYKPFTKKSKKKQGGGLFSGEKKKIKGQKRRVRQTKGKSFGKGKVTSKKTRGPKEGGGKKIGLPKLFVRG